jgi:hypothetical protein
LFQLLALQLLRRKLLFQFSFRLIQIRNDLISLVPNLSALLVQAKLISVVRLIDLEVIRGMW